MNSIERFLLALGGFTGFACAFFAALKGGSGVDGALMRASIAMIAAAFMMKLFLFIIRTTLQDNPPAATSRSAKEIPNGRTTASATAENN